MLAAMLSEHPRGREGWTGKKQCGHSRGKRFCRSRWRWRQAPPFRSTPSRSFSFGRSPIASASKFPPEDRRSSPPVAPSPRFSGAPGYQLVGPLGRRGEQIVATGVSRREGDMRFIIDPYEGRILRAVRLGPPPMYDRGPRYGGDYGPSGGDAYGRPPRPAALHTRRRAPAVPGLRPGRIAGRQQPGGAALADKAPNSPSQQRARAAQKSAASKSSRAIAPTTKPEAPSEAPMAIAPAASPAPAPQD